MEKITLDNYEAFLLDYAEGRLPEEHIEELNTFLLVHPELEIDLGEIELPYLNIETTGRTASFETLLKSDDDMVLNNRFVAYIEDVMPPSEKIIFEKEVAGNTDLKKELRLYQKTVLQAETSIKYPSKSDLYRKGRVITLFETRTLGRLAAAIFLIVGMVFLFRYTQTKSLIEPIAVNKQIIKVGVPGKVQETKNHSQSTANQTKVEHSVDKTRLEEPAVAVVKQRAEDEISEDLKQAGPVKEIQNIKPQNTEPENLIVQAKSGSDTTDNSLASIEEIIDEEEDLSDEKPKTFWHRAVALAKQANKLGVRSVDGVQNADKSFRLSFNSLTVERK